MMLYGYYSNGEVWVEKDEDEFIHLASDTCYPLDDPKILGDIKVLLNSRWGGKLIGR
jgi:hypothetical protein